MRVAVLSYQWPGLRMGGIGTYVMQAAAALAAAGHDPHVFALDVPDAVAVDVPPGVTLHRTPDLARRVHDGTLPAPLAAAINGGGEAVYRLAVAWLLTAAFRAVHRRHPFDVVEVADVDASGLPLLLDPARDVPVVAHLHTCTAIANRVNGNVDGPGPRLIEAIEAAQLHLADGLCAATRAVVASTRGVMRLDAEPTVIPYPYTCPAGPFQPPPLDGPIVFVGRLERRKGCDLLAAALPRFLARNPSARFRFLGPDTDTAPGGTSMRQHIRNSLPAPLADRVDLPGEQSRSGVDAALRRASFCVQPSVSENFSLALCEAMAAGRTTIVADGTGSVDVVGDAGVAVPAGSTDALAGAMEVLHRDRPRLAALSARAHARVRTLCNPTDVSNLRVSFYRTAIEQFARAGTAETIRRLRTLDGDVIAAVLPAMAGMTAAMVGAGDDASTGTSPGHRLAKVCRKAATAGPARVLLYGAGKHTARLLSERHAWERDGHRVVGLIDDHPRFAGGATYLDLPVRSVAATEAAAAAGEPVPAVVLSTDTYQGQFWQQTAGLRRRGIRVFTLYEGA